MATLTKPLSAVVNVLSVAWDFIAKKIIPQGIRKVFTNEGPDGPFLPVTYIPLKDLTVDPKYQRLINTTFIRQAKEFKPEFVKPLSVFQRPDGTFVVVDGQHTSVLAATYVQDPEDFKLPCQIQVHPSEFTTDQCEKAEARYFKEFNTLRNKVSSVAKLRADVAQGAEYALDLEEKFKALNIHVEQIGAPDDGTNGVKGYDKLRVALGKYGTTYVRKAIETYKGHNRDTSKLCKWSKPLNGGFIFGLAAAYSFLDSISVTNTGDKYENFNTFLNTAIKHYSIEDFTTNTAGPIQDILILEEIKRVYLVLSPSNGWATIGEKTWDDWRSDQGIHGKTAKGISKVEETEED